MELSTPSEPQKKCDAAHKKPQPSHLCRGKKINWPDRRVSESTLVFVEDFCALTPRNRRTRGNETSGMPGLVPLPLNCFLSQTLYLTWQLTLKFNHVFESTHCGALTPRGNFNITFLQTNLVKWESCRVASYCTVCYTAPCLG